MIITHHLDDATLMSYAAGSLPNALAGVVATHVAMCPRCHGELAHHEFIGAAMVEGIPPVPLAGPAPVPQLDETAPAAIIRSNHAGGDVPAPLARLLGDRLDAIRWKPLAIGVWHHRLPLAGHGSGDLRLIKAGPGRGLPEHGHTGAELTLVLRGAYRDEVGIFRAGDVADLDEEVEHHPVADASGCICLMACERPARFRGLLARLLAPWHGL